MKQIQMQEARQMPSEQCIRNKINIEIAKSEMTKGNDMETALASALKELIKPMIESEMEVGYNSDDEHVIEHVANEVIWIMENDVDWNEVVRVIYNS